MSRAVFPRGIRRAGARITVTGAACIRAFSCTEVSFSASRPSARLFWGIRLCWWWGWGWGWGWRI